eukprot:scaffold268534_cov31-Tisochrysis_lutea.AAC.4
MSSRSVAPWHRLAQGSVASARGDIRDDSVVLVGQIALIDDRGGLAVLGQKECHHLARAHRLEASAVLAADCVALKEHGPLVPQLHALNVDLWRRHRHESFTAVWSGSAGSA